jgi:tungstate transport system ATP-binding protein
MVSILPLTLSNATARMRGKTLVGPVSLTLPPDGFTMVIGPNGAGKTTLLRLMHGLQRCASGSVAWAKADARTKQAFVFQSPTMMRRKVLDNLAYPLRLRGMGRAAALEKATQCAGNFGLENLLESWAPLLSGGEKQKLSLARALITEPEILFLDEPCASLDGRATREIEAILRGVQARGTRVVMSTHDMGQARRLAQDVIFMLHGKIHEHSPANVFFTTPTTPEAKGFINGDIIE